MTAMWGGLDAGVMDESTNTALAVINMRNARGCPELPSLTRGASRRMQYYQQQCTAVKCIQHFLPT